MLTNPLFKCIFPKKSSAFYIIIAVLAMAAAFFVSNSPVFAADDNVNAPDCETFYDD